MTAVKNVLVVVEASGKVDHLRQVLKGLGIYGTVMATLGHVGTNPASLVPIELDSDLRETAYRLNPERQSLVNSIHQAAFRADRIFLAMDDDQEGDVIAYDLAQELSDFSDKLERVRLRAISESELRRAFDAAAPIDFKVPAHNGTCRRIVDRAIGATFSVFDNKAPISTGRVQSSLLAQLSAVRPSIGVFTLEAKLASGDLLQASIPISSLAEIKRLESIQAVLDAGGGRIVACSETEVTVSTPWGFEDVVFESSIRLKIGIEEAAKGFQEVYERGKVSYPRAKANGFTDEAIDTARGLAKHNRASFDGALLPGRQGLGGTMPHESPRALDDEMQLGRALTVLDTPDAIAVLISRNMIECGQLIKVRRVDIDIEGRVFAFSTCPTAPMRPWKVPAKQPGVIRFSLEQALLRYMAEHDLGRSSTIVPHVKKFLRRDLVTGQGDNPFELTRKGRRWLEHATSVGLGADTSRRMEARFAEAMDDPSRMARDILREHGLLGRVQDAIGTSKNADKTTNLAECGM